MFLVETQIDTKFGTFNQLLHYNGQTEAVVLVMGDVNGADGVLCRVHSACKNGHSFNSTECDCADQMAAAQNAIAKSGRGIVLLLDQEGKGNGYLALLLSKKYKASGMKQGDAYRAAGYQPDARNYAQAASVRLDLGVKSVVLLTEGTSKAEGLIAHGVKVLSTQSV
jgi:GTP cyclohydrolase II